MKIMGVIWKRKFHEFTTVNGVTWINVGPLTPCPANDGPEVDLIRFFGRFPEGTRNGNKIGG